MPENGILTPGDYAEDWRNHPEWASKRFGSAAYISPINAWPDITNLSNYHKDLQVNRVGDNGSGAKYNVGYTRTGRDLGTYNTYYNLGSDANIHPYIADQILNQAEELDRIDPNFYVYSLRNAQAQNKYTPPTTAGPVKTSAVQALYAPYGQGTLQQQGLASNASQAIQALLSWQK